ncbi:putative heat shock protein 70 family protein [Tanacetum coccineum]|uniref:Heat shock protein 70 family protein n=1 Tax=Tanacetum coccineum TaxID=301880 RepID=A0ABQ4Y1W8_9ASTR
MCYKPRRGSCSGFKNEAQIAIVLKLEQSSEATGIGIDIGTTYYISRNRKQHRRYAKRLIGRKFSDSKVQEDVKLWPFKVIQGLADTPKIVVTYKGQNKEFLAEEVSSMILGKMKEIADAYLGKEVKNAVITVPAYFNDSQRQATKDAGIIAGLNIMRMINEPTAAAIAYEGGIFEVKAVAGDTHLGGEDFDNQMMDHCVREFKRKWKKDLTGNKRAMGRLRFACENGKRILSSATQTSLELDGLHAGVDFSMRFTRAKFEELNMSLIPMGPVLWLREFFDGKELCKSVHPDEAIAYGAAIIAAKLTGIRDKNVQERSTCIKVKEAKSTDNHLLGMFITTGIPPAPKGEIQFKDCFDIDADGILTVTSQILSAGIADKLTVSSENGRLSKEEIERMIKMLRIYTSTIERIRQEKLEGRMEACHLSDVTRWLDDNQGASIDELQHKKKFLESYGLLCKSVHPYEAIAYGAAIVAAKLTGTRDKNVQEVVLTDVTPLSLGIAIKGDLFDVAIPRNTQIPTKKYKNYVSVVDNQTCAETYVYQGERSKSTDNHLLGMFVTTGIPPAPKGEIQFKDCFDIDADGILTVTSQILSAGIADKLTISSENGRLSKEEIERMIKDAEKYKLEDQEYKKRVKAFNALEDCLYTMKKNTKEYTGNNREIRKNLKKMEHAIADVTRWLDDNQGASIDELQHKKKFLESVGTPLI